MSDAPELPPLPEADGMLENGYLYVILSKIGQHGRACFDAGRAPLLEAGLAASELVLSLTKERDELRAKLEAAQKEIGEARNILLETLEHALPYVTGNPALHMNIRIAIAAARSEKP